VAVDKVYGSLIDYNNGGSYNRGQQGVFGLHPLATPKYAANNGERDAEFKETLARMYIALPDGFPITDYLLTLPQDPATMALAGVLLGNGNSKSNVGFIDFFLQQVNESFQECVQVDKVMGDNYVAFYFGQEPPTFQFSGSLLNSMQDNQRSGFALAYQHLMRGTQLARRNALVRIKYDSVIVSGTMTSHTQSLNAENEMVVPFSFSLLVKEYVVLPPTKFARVSSSDYVKLFTDFSARPLNNVGRVTDVRVRSVMIPPADSALGLTTTDGPAALAATTADVVAVENTNNIPANVPTTAKPPPAATVIPDIVSFNPTGARIPNARFE